MKKFITALLVTAIILSFPMSVFAEDEESKSEPMSAVEYIFMTFFIVAILGTIFGYKLIKLNMKHKKEREEKEREWEREKMEHELKVLQVQSKMFDDSVEDLAKKYNYNDE